MNERRVPTAFQEELVGSVGALVESIECVEAPPPPPVATGDEDDDEDDGKGKGKKKGKKKGKGKD